MAGSLFAWVLPCSRECSQFSIPQHPHSQAQRIHANYVFISSLLFKLVDVKHIALLGRLQADVDVYTTTLPRSLEPTKPWKLCWADAELPERDLVDVAEVRSAKYACFDRQTRCRRMNTC
jgi:hypothetical protein